MVISIDSLKEVKLESETQIGNSFKSSLTLNSTDFNYSQKIASLMFLSFNGPAHLLTNAKVSK